MADREKIIADLSTALVQMYGCGSYTSKDADELETAALGALKLLEGQDMERLEKAANEAEAFMQKAPYLGYTHAKELIAAAKEVAKYEL